MNWISSFHTTFGCHVNVVRLEIYNGLFFCLKWDQIIKIDKVISVMRPMITKENNLNFFSLIKRAER